MVQVNGWRDAALPVAGALCAIFGLAYPCTSLWNALAPAVHVSYWQAVLALTLVFLSQIPLFIFARFARW